METRLTLHRLINLNDEIMPKLVTRLRDPAQEARCRAMIRFLFDEMVFQRAFRRIGKP